MEHSRDTVLLLEELAANAVAAPTVQLVGGWLLRAWPEAPFRRTNSVLAILRSDSGSDPGSDLGDGAFAARCAVVEEFYRRRGLPVRFQLGAVTTPPDLDARLAQRGYVVEAPTLVQAADAARVAAGTYERGLGVAAGTYERGLGVAAGTYERGPGVAAGTHERGPGLAAATHQRAVQVVLADEIDPVWIAAYGEAHGADPATRRRLEPYGRLLERIGPRCITATARLTGEAAAVASGFAVLERGWAGVFGMGTRPDARRRGAARAVLHALARGALERGAGAIYLQVEADNAAALRLYGDAGFATVYRYHYRTLGLGESAA